MKLTLLLSFQFAATLANAQFGNMHINNFKKGYYYDNNGVKVKGRIEKSPQIYTNIPPKARYILFKTDSSGEKSEILLQDLKSFVIEKDSFVVVLVKSNTQLRHTIDNILGYYYDVDEMPKSLFSD